MTTSLLELSGEKYGEHPEWQRKALALSQWAGCHEIDASGGPDGQRGCYATFVPVVKAADLGNGDDAILAGGAIDSGTGESLSSARCVRERW